MFVRHGEAWTYLSIAYSANFIWFMELSVQFFQSDSASGKFAYNFLVQVSFLQISLRCFELNLSLVELHLSLHT